MEKENFLDQHKCEAVVLTCMDFRFREDLQRFIKEEMGLSFDLIATAGSAKELISGGPRRMTVFQDLMISKSLHKTKKIVVVHHIDCGAYGGSKGFKSRRQETMFQKGQLRKAAAVLKSDIDFSDAEIILLFVNEKEGEPQYLRV